MATNARRLSERIPDLSNLAMDLQRYADFMYTPAKHDFSLPPGRRHRFSAEEVVFAAYVTIELGKRIKNTSKFAAYTVEKDYLYSIDGRWGSGERVSYGGGGFEKPFD